ncbi:MAG: hypothetical protein Q8M93_16940 [Polaromonas sp.]|uniref:hypothetical protein n=1 Tax=Polaromonas sp. TaxID=1869339 RepID=UPI002730DE24|nr:hypothetical protein [Polaromonas sp.]MDP2448726.1 hypothetical protein [Polaromonas sp.]MDP3248633.1 hypothetical protein [Polaromonas sp.]MDP3758047.1 hypothetical protein [Polaromonas sp.]
MAIVGEVISVFGFLRNAWKLRKERRDPTRLSANRLITAFEAHGIARQQIIRLLPAPVLEASPEVTMADFSSPEKLQHKLSPQLLDWAAEYLNLKRAWLDGVDEPPHVVIDRYKRPAEYRAWFQARQAQAPEVGRWMSVWKAKGEEIGPDGSGPLCLVYEETSEGLDSKEWSRYWLLSDEWRLDHSPCVENMAAAVAVARSLGILVTGHGLPLDKLTRVTTGKMLIPQAALHRRGRWYPEDLADPAPGRNTEWQRAVWEGGQAWLAEAHRDTP